MARDQQLLSELSSDGRETALSELMDRHGRMVERTARRITGDDAQAADVCQAVFLVLLNRASGLGSVASLGSWLHRTAVLVSYKSLRARSRRRKHEEEAAKMHAARDRKPAELPAEFDEAMARLPDTYREVIIRRFLEQRSRSEVARDLGVNEGAVDMRLSRALERLRRALTPSMAGLTIAGLAQLLTAESAHAAQVGAISASALLSSSPATEISALAKGTAKTMFWLKVKSAVVSSIIVASVAGSAAAAIHVTNSDEKPPQADTPAKNAADDGRKPLDPAVESAKLKLPLKTWVARPYDRGSNKPAARNGSKHLRLALCPINGLIYCLGGDYSSDFISDDQLWTYDVLTDKWARDLEPVFGKQGDVMPGGPDEVCWVWDSKRKQFWTSPGFFFLSEAVMGEGGATSSWGEVNKPLVLDGYAVYTIYDKKTAARFTEGKDFKVAVDTPAKDKITLTNISVVPGDLVVAYQPPGHAKQILGSLTYDPFKKKWTEAPEMASGGPRNGVYDPISDSIWRATWDGNGDLCWTQYECETKKLNGFTNIKSPSGVTVRTAALPSEYIAIDVKGRKIYAVDPWDFRLLQFDIETKQTEVKAPIPEVNPGHIKAARARQWGFADGTMPVFDSVNNVLLYPFVDGCATSPEPTVNKWGSRPKLLIYHPDTDRWEEDAMKQPEGLEVRGNTFMFDELHNCLISVGGLEKDGDADASLSHYFIYRYGDGKGAAAK